MDRLDLLANRIRRKIQSPGHIVEASTRREPEGRWVGRTSEPESLQAGTNMYCAGKTMGVGPITKMRFRFIAL